MDTQTDGRIVGKPTLLVTYGIKVDAQAILDAIGGLGYPLSDVSVYYRVSGTDQVLDAITGQVAAGQALSPEELRGKAMEKLETLVLLHPDAEQFVALQSALKPLGEADMKYAAQDVAGGDTGGGADDDTGNQVPVPDAPQAG